MWLCTPRGFYSAVAKPDYGDEYVRPAGVGSRTRSTPSSAATRRPYGTPAGSGPWVVTDRPTDDRDLETGLPSEGALNAGVA